MFTTIKSLFLLSLFSLTSASQGAESTEFSEGGFEFVYGGPCSALAELTEAEMVAIIHPSHSEEFAAFCMPEDVYNCSDYNSLLYQLGSLERYDGLTCRFTPSN